MKIGIFKVTEHVASKTGVKYGYQENSRAFDVLQEKPIWPTEHTHDKSKLGPDVFTKHLI